MIFLSLVLFCFNRNSLELALARPITVLDNERFTVQSVITKLVCPVVLVSSQWGVSKLFLQCIWNDLFSTSSKPNVKCATFASLVSFIMSPFRWRFC